MTVSDEELMALIDGELDPARAAAVEQEMAANPELAGRVAEQRALRDRLRGAFDPILREPLPRRLATLVSRDRVVDFEAARATRRHRNAWFGGFGLAAGVLIGALLGPQLRQTLRPQADVLATEAGLEARGHLADALSHQLAADQSATAPIQIGISFTAKSGESCRTFVSRQGAVALAGLACRHGATWSLDAIQSEAATARDDGDYRQAASSLPPLILRAAEDRIDGDPFDTQAEAAARVRDWKPARAEN